MILEFQTCQTCSTILAIINRKNIVRGLLSNKREDPNSMCFPPILLEGLIRAHSFRYALWLEIGISPLFRAKNTGISRLFTPYYLVGMMRGDVWQNGREQDESKHNQCRCHRGCHGYNGRGVRAIQLQILC